MCLQWANNFHVILRPVFFAYEARCKKLSRIRGLRSFLQEATIAPKGEQEEERLKIGSTEPVTVVQDP